MAGVVGAGGGGFPAHVKLAGRADTVIANGAECEPLLHKDAAVMEHFAEAVVAGVRLSMEAVGAGVGVVGIKAKNEHAVESIRAACRGTAVRVHLLGDYYPAGDEYDLVHEVTGRSIPSAGLPLDVGCVVNNVETLANVAAAEEGRPVVDKVVTIAGAVRDPLTMRVPVGTSWSECCEAAGGITVAKPWLFVGGLMMGELTSDLSAPVTKTSTGIVVLPEDHAAVRRRLTPRPAQAHIGRSACDQCRYCTEFCPRYLLGYSVEPHQVMRGLGFGSREAERWNEWAALCCSCGLCTVFACPEQLFPREACDDAKAVLRKAGWKWDGRRAVKPHPLRDGRRVPIQGLMRKLEVQGYAHPAPWRAVGWNPAGVTLPLKQHAGAPVTPVVRVGERVRLGQVVGTMASGVLGAELHASIDGEVVAVTEKSLRLERGG